MKSAGNGRTSGRRGRAPESAEQLAAQYKAQSRSLAGLLALRGPTDIAIPVGEVTEDVEWSEWEDSVLQHDTQFYADEILQTLLADSVDVAIDGASPGQ